jgi:hypothetical protein
MTRIPAAAWFLRTEDGQPLGQLYRYEGDEMPVTGVVLTDGASWNRAEVVEYEELLSTCAMRRFRVVVRLLE